MRWRLAEINRHYQHAVAGQCSIQNCLLETVATTPVAAVNIHDGGKGSGANRSIQARLQAWLVRRIPDIETVLPRNGYGPVAQTPA
jgi:hypothetical protein